MNTRDYKTYALKRKAFNLMHSLVLLIAMALLLGLLGWIFAGPSGIRWAIIIAVVSFMVTPHLPPQITLRWYAARPLPYRSASALHAIVKELAQRAKLPEIPAIYYVPTRVLNAFTTGNRGNAAIALTDGLINSLNMRELTGVIAHEISHLKNNDLWIMNLSNTISRLTSVFSTFGQFLLILNLPLLLAAGQSISWLGILILIFAPTLTMLLQLALSRTREFDADLDAAMLTNDPQGLASALSKMERFQQGWLQRIWLPGYGRQQSSILRTHPQTRQRIERLLTLAPGKRRSPHMEDAFKNTAYNLSTPSIRLDTYPRWRIGGIW